MVRAFVDISRSDAARRPAGAVLIAVALVLSPAALADDPAAEVAARAAERGVSPDLLVGPVREAELRGLPSRPVADKVLEGIAKGIPAERVAAVATALVARLGEADGLLQGTRSMGLAPPADRAAALADLAHALGAGVDRSAVEALAAAARGKGSAADVVVAAAALGALARRGVPVAEAMPLGRALVASPRHAPDVGPAFDAWRAHGGRDVAEFLSETERRVVGGRSVSDTDRRGGRDSMGERRGAMGGEGRRGGHP